MVQVLSLGKKKIYALSNKKARLEKEMEKENNRMEEYHEQV
jgi:hypothetical protein